MEMIANNINANLLVLLPATYVIIFMVVLPFPTLASTEITSFSFPDPDPWTNEKLRWTDDAAVSSKGIELTTDNIGSNLDFSTGWATYYRRLHLWDNETGRVADFTSNFSFVIQAVPGRKYADCLSFFLAANVTTMRNGSSRGGGCGLVNSTIDKYDGSYPPFIAVEFDTCINHWDPKYEHVGIDINTVHSVRTAPWNWNKITSGGKVNVSVVYNSSQQTLSVEMIDAANASLSTGLNYNVSLKDYLPEWVTFGFSAATGRSYETHTIQSWNFISSLEVPDHDKWQWIITGVGSFLVFWFVLGFLWFRYQSKRSGGNLCEDEQTTEPIHKEFAMLTAPKRFSFKEVSAATNDFSNDLLLGEGGFGKVYKGYLREGAYEVAIKKITPGSKQGIKEFATEVKIISQLRHRNLVQLVGWCHQKKELLLIYEFMSNGSLDTHLFKGRSLLTWEMRHKIAQGIASALLYLHEEWEQCVLHRDIKASNVMLDSDFTAKLGDFGLARLVDHAKGSQTTVLAGTMGYMAPECLYTGKVNKESDIYSFGVVILEIACGRRVNDQIDGRLVDWVWELYGIGKLLDAVDPKLGGDYDPRQMHSLMVVGLWCAHPEYDSRPTIREALNVLNFEALPPLLPPRPPVPPYAKANAYGPSRSILSLCDTPNSSSGGEYSSSEITSLLASSALLMDVV